jgi:desulfoferrodoxin-like iron-binding protein
MANRLQPIKQSTTVDWIKTMTSRTYIESILLGALVALLPAGYMIHARTHLIAQNPAFLMPFVADILSVAVIPALFWYKGEVCGNIVEVLHGGAGKLVCCGQPMKLIKENTTDAAKEKHVPVVYQVFRQSF